MSTSAKATDSSFGRGGVGNIEAARALQRRKEEEEVKEKSSIADKTRAEEMALAETIQVPKPVKLR